MNTILWVYRLYVLPLMQLRPCSRWQQQRMSQPAYRAKRSIVKSLWIGAGIVMLSFPQLPLIITVSLFTTFLSFTILDETA